MYFGCAWLRVALCALFCFVICFMSVVRVGIVATIPRRESWSVIRHDFGVAFWKCMKGRPHSLLNKIIYNFKCEFYYRTIYAGVSVALFVCVRQVASKSSTAASSNRKHLLSIYLSSSSSCCEEARLGCTRTIMTIHSPARRRSRLVQKGWSSSSVSLVNIMRNIGAILDKLWKVINI